MRFATPASVQFSDFPGAIRADPRKLDPMRHHLVPGASGHSLFDDVYRFHGHIIHSAAHTAANVVMIFGCSVEASLSASQVQFQDETLTRQKLEVTIDRSNADLREVFPHQLMQFVSSWVTSELPEHIKDDLSLSGHSA